MAEIRTLACPRRSRIFGFCRVITSGREEQRLSAGTLSPGVCPHSRKRELSLSQGEVENRNGMINVG